MIDLKFSYTLPSGTRVTEEFDTIMLFTDAVENGNFPKADLNSTDVDATFFESRFNQKHFNSIKELYNHCVSITK